MALRIKSKTLSRIKAGGSLLIDRTHPLANEWDRLAARGEVKTKLVGGKRIEVTAGDGRPCKPLARAARASGASHLRNWADLRRTVKAGG